MMKILKNYSYTIIVVSMAVITGFIYINSL